MKNGKKELEAAAAVAHVQNEAATAQAAAATAADAKQQAGVLR